MSTTVNGHVLVGEDNPVNGAIAVRLLTGRGTEVDVVADGREALERHASGGYEAIFLGSQLPSLDGLAVAREIRRREDGSDHRTPIVVMTPMRRRGDTERCIAAGVDYCSGRPISPAGLDYVLSRALAHRAGVGLGLGAKG